MSEQPKLELIYFTGRALAESPQMMMRYAGVEYRYEMAWDYYGKPWSETKLSLIHISEPTRRYAISYAVFC